MVNDTPLIGEMLKGQMVILRGDVQRFARAASHLSARALARPAQLTESPLRGITSDDWAATDRTLRSLERAWHEDEMWQPRRSVDWRVTGNEEGYILRRVVDPWTSVEFGDLCRRWRGRADDLVFVEDISADDRSSVVDVTAPDPLDYMIIKHAAQVSSYTGIDKTGIRFRQNRTPLYRTTICADYQECLAHGEPRAFDIFWQVARFKEGSFYRRLLLPCGNRMVSVSLIQRWKFPAGWD
ncbi:hypothetical protein [Thalassobaculum sp.]|uniref:hypothetical protein n=1 Tax=Thalassobaculum sp. TaxID=2022740 RepID=UPI0032EE93D4